MDDIGLRMNDEMKVRLEKEGMKPVYYISLCFECVCVCVSRACAILAMRMESHSIQIVYTHRCVFTSSVRLPYCVEKRNDGCQLHTLTLFPSTVVARAVCVCVRVRS